MAAQRLSTTAIAIAIAVGAALLALLVHLPALRAELIWDDRIVLLDQLVAITGLRDAFFPPDGIPNWSSAYYRPLVLVSYLVDYRWLGRADGVFAAHLANLLYHAVVTASVGLLAHRLLAPAAVVGASEPGGAGIGVTVAIAFAALLFAVHPLHVESVNWISGRSDVLAAMFLLPSVLLALRYRDRGSAPALAGSALLLLLALLCKETAITAVVLVPLAWWLVPGRPGGPDGPAFVRNPRTWLAMLAFGVAVAIYLALRMAAGTESQAGADIGLALSAIALLRAFGWYVTVIAIPWPLTNLVGWELLPGLVTAGLAAGVVALALALAWRRWRESRDGLPLFALAWFLLTLLPSLWIALTFVTHAPVADRYLYLPSAGFALAAGWLVRELLVDADGRRRSAVIAGAGAMLLAYAVSAFSRGVTWSDEVALWTDATAKSPTSVFAWQSLARAHAERGEQQPAIDAYRRAIAVADGDPTVRAKVLYALGEIELRRGEFAAARRFFADSGQASSQFTRDLLGAGLTDLVEAEVLEGADGDSTRIEALRRAAEQRLRAALVRTPDLHEARVTLAAMSLVEAGRCEARGDRPCTFRAVETAARELAALPSWSTARQNAYFREAEPGVPRDIPRLRADVAALGQRLAGREPD